MLAWVVINRKKPRQSTPKSSSLRTLCLCVKFSDSFPPTSVVSTAYAHPSPTVAPHPLCNQSIRHSFHLDGGVPPLSPQKATTNQPPTPYPHLHPPLPPRRAGARVTHDARDATQTSLCVTPRPKRD